MGHILQIEISEELFKQLLEKAARAGKTPEEIAKESVVSLFAEPFMDPALIIHDNAIPIDFSTDRELYVSADTAKRKLTTTDGTFAVTDAI